MSDEKKADMDAAMAELEHELYIAIKQGAIKRLFQWQHVFSAGRDEPWIALLTVGPVSEAKQDGQRQT